MARAAPLPENEVERLARLRSLAVLDTDAEPLFDALTRAASLVVGAPIATLTLIDEHRQWFKSRVGLDGASEGARETAFCAHAILDDAVFEVPDARLDERFADNPLVTGAPDIRFYAGAPITLRDGLRMGTLCVIDPQPRTLTDPQRAILTQLARAAGEALEQRLLALQRDDALQQAAEAGRKLALIVDATGTGTCEWNVSTNAVRFNARWRRLTGRADADGTVSDPDPWLDGVHPDDRERAARLLRQHFRGDTPSYDVEVRVRDAQGIERWVRDRGRVSSGRNGDQALWMFGTRVDVTERKAAQIALARSEDMLERTGQLSGVGGWELDLRTQDVRWSDQTCRLHDRPPGHKPTLDEGLSYYEEQARPVIQAAVEHALAGGGGWDLELPIVTAKGRHFWCRTIGAVEFGADGKAERVIGSFQDITLRRRAVASLEISERRFRKLFQYSLGLICTHDLSGVLLSVNPAAAHSLGWSVAELMGQPLQQFMAPQFHEAFAAYLARIGTNGSDSGVLKLLARDGSTRVWEYHNVLDDESGDPYVLGHAQDISERQKQVQQLLDLSIRDPLTGCFNRRFLSDLAAHLKPGDRWGCIAVDLDRFKLVNDTYGHQRGDEVLVGIAKFLQQHLRAEDVVVRSGGDEFLVLLRNADEMLTENVVRRLHDDRRDAPIAFTLGHATRKCDELLDDVLLEADRGLYAQRALRDAPAAASR